MIPDPVLLIVVPLVAAFIVPVTSLANRKLASYVPLFGLLIMGAISIWIMINASDGAVTSTTGGFDPPWGISLVVTPLAAIITMAMAGVGIFVALSHAGIERDVWFSTMVMMATTGGVGMVITGDLFNLFVFMEITAIASTILAAFPRNGSGYNWKGAVTYAIVSGLASFLVLGGIAMLYGSTSTLNIAQMAERAHEIPSYIAGVSLLLLLVGFGIEGEIFPLNGWVPEVYRGSRWGTASVFSGIVGKAGIIVLIRMIILIISPAMGNDFPVDILLWGGVVTYIVAEAAAFTSKDLYRMMGYSSIGFLGLILASISIGTSNGIQAGVFLLLGHMIIKPLIFSVVDHAGNKKTGEVSLRNIQGLIGRSPVSGILFVAGSLALIGMPPSPVFWGKYLLFTGAGSASDWGLLAAVFIGTLLEAGYLGRLMWSSISKGKLDGKRSVFPLTRMIPGTVLVIITMIIGAAPWLLRNFLDLAVKELTDPLEYIRWGGF